MKTTLAMIALLALAVTGGAGAASDTEDADKMTEARLDFHIANCVLALALESQNDVDLPTEWVPLERFVKTFPEPYRKRMPVTDPWVNPYSARLLGGNFVVVSRGPNGLLEAFPAVDGESPPPVPQTDREVRGDDIVLIVGGPVLNGPRTDRDRQQGTMDDIRTIGTGVEEYSIDNDLYPSQPGRLAPVEEIRPAITPLYIRELPAKDAWGNDILYWSDERSYIIVSMGADGALDQSYATDGGSLGDLKFAGAFADASTDLVFANGQFVQWPAGSTR